MCFRVRGPFEIYRRSRYMLIVLVFRVLQCPHVAPTRQIVASCRVQHITHLDFRFGKRMDKFEASISETPICPGAGHVSPTMRLNYLYHTFDECQDLCIAHSVLLSVIAQPFQHISGAGI